MGLDITATGDRGEFSFRAGSYTGYNRWRELLSIMALGVRPPEVWKKPEAYAGKPFVELIDFSDCEGTLDSATARKLSKDFADYSWQTEQFLDGEDGEWFCEKYQEWQRAFELAAGDGRVEFH